MKGHFLSTCRQIIIFLIALGLFLTMCSTPTSMQFQKITNQTTTMPQNSFYANQPKRTVASNHTQQVLDFAYLALQAGQSQEVRDLLRDHPALENRTVKIAYSEALLALDEVELAILHLLSANKLQESWDVHWKLATAYTQLADFEKALVHYADAMNQGPTSTLVLNDYAYTLAAMGKIELAIETMQQSLRTDSSQYYLNWQLGDWAASIENYQLAIGFWQTAQRIRPNKEVQAQIENAHRFLPRPEPLQVQPEPPSVQLVHHHTVTKTGNASPIRVGLMEKVTTLTFSAGADFLITSSESTSLRAAGKTLWQIRLDPNEKDKIVMRSSQQEIQLTPPIRLVQTQPTTTFAIYDMAYGSGYFWAGRETRQYRGDMEFLLYPQGITVVNELPLEEYLYAVVPGEMIASWPMEALKAQAVAARTYTVFHLGRYHERGFDLLASVASAHYPGVSREHQRTTTAVNETKGQIITYLGQPIDAVYSANNGGIRASSAEVWGGNRAYLVSGHDGDELPFQSPTAFLHWLKDDADVYSNIGRQRSNFRWTRTYSRQELQRFAPTQIGELLDLRILDRGESGRVVTIEWVGTLGSTQVHRDAIRSSLGGLRSNLFIMHPRYNSDNTQIMQVIIWGAGWGHGVGMSQTGAYGMSERGYNYEDIIRFYYPSTQLQTR